METVTVFPATSKVNGSSMALAVVRGRGRFGVRSRAGVRAAPHKCDRYEGNEQRE